MDELRGQPGTRVPHLWLQRDGQRVSTLDLLGPGFTVFTGADGDRWLSAAASASLGVPVGAYWIGVDAVDIDGAWAATTGLAPDGALVVRPDDFVGWRNEELPADPGSRLHQVLSAILG